MQSAYPQSIPIGSHRAGYSALESLPPGYSAPSHNCHAAFTLVTPTRQYVMATESAGEREDWVKWLQIVIDYASDDDNN